MTTEFEVGGGKWGGEEVGRRGGGCRRPGGVSAGGRLQLGDGQGGAGGLGGAAVLQRVLAVAAHTHTRSHYTLGQAIWCLCVGK